MAFCELHYFSKALGMQTAANVILPEGDEHKPPFAVFYLLHGLSDDDTIWLRRTSVERYVAGLPLVLVMPDGGRGWYTNAAEGDAYEDDLMKDIRGLVERTFPVKAERSGRAIGGLSMGGYGAVKWALRQPERFAAAATLSGALDVAHLQRYDRRPHMRELTARVFAGRDVAGSPDDLLHLVATSDPGTLPRLMLRCGTEDHLVAQNERFVAACRAHGVALDSGFGPGAHEWGYWDTEIRTVLDRL